MHYTTLLLSLAFSVSVFATTACDADTIPLPMEGSKQAVAGLRLVNYPGTTSHYLRAEVGLTKRQAEAVVAYRDGADRMPVTQDDDTFDSLAELAGVIDATTITTVVTMALDRGWMPDEDAFVGVYDGVSFKLSEAEWVLDIVNEGTRAELDDDAALHSNVVDAIMAGRPFHSVERISALPKMGAVNMGNLKAYAVSQANSKPLPTQL